MVNIYVSRCFLLKSGVLEHVLSLVLDVVRHLPTTGGSCARLSGIAFAAGLGMGSAFQACSADFAPEVGPWELRQLNSVAANDKLC